MIPPTPILFLGDYAPHSYFGEMVIGMGIIDGNRVGYSEFGWRMWGASVFGGSWLGNVKMGVT